MDSWEKAPWSLSNSFLLQQAELLELEPTLPRLKRNFADGKSAWIAVTTQTEQLMSRLISMHQLLGATETGRQLQYMHRQQDQITSQVTSCNDTIERLTQENLKHINQIQSLSKEIEDQTLSSQIEDELALKEVEIERLVEADAELRQRNAYLDEKVGEMQRLLEEYEGSLEDYRGYLNTQAKAIEEHVIRAKTPQLSPMRTPGRSRTVIPPSTASCSPYKGESPTEELIHKLQVKNAQYSQTVHQLNEDLFLCKQQLKAFEPAVYTPRTKSRLTAIKHCIEKGQIDTAIKLWRDEDFTELGCDSAFYVKRVLDYACKLPKDKQTTQLIEALKQQEEEIELLRSTLISEPQTNDLQAQLRQKDKEIEDLRRVMQVSPLASPVNLRTADMPRSAEDGRFEVHASEFLYQSVFRASTERESLDAEHNWRLQVQDLEAVVRDLDSQVARLELEKASMKKQLDRQEDYEDNSESYLVPLQLTSLQENVIEMKKALSQQEIRIAQLSSDNSRLQQDLVKARALRVKRIEETPEFRRLRDQLHQTEELLLAERKRQGETHDRQLKPLSAHSNRPASRYTSRSTPESEGASVILETPSEVDENHGFADVLDDKNLQIAELTVKLTTAQFEVDSLKALQTPRFGEDQELRRSIAAKEARISTLERIWETQEVCSHNARAQLISILEDCPEVEYLRAEIIEIVEQAASESAYELQLLQGQAADLQSEVVKLKREKQVSVISQESMETDLKRMKALFEEERKAHAGTLAALRSKNVASADKQREEYYSRLHATFMREIEQLAGFVGILRQDIAKKEAHLDEVVTQSEQDVRLNRQLLAEERRKVLSLTHRLEETARVQEQVRGEKRQTAISELHGLLGVKDQEVEGLLKQKAQMAEDLERMNEACVRLEEEVKGLAVQKERDQLSKAETANEQVAQLKRQVEEAQSKITSLQKALETAQREQAEAVKQLKAEQKAHLKDLDQKNSDIDRLREEQAASQANQKELGSLSQLKTEVEMLQAELRALRQMNHQLTTELSELQTHNSDLERKLNETLQELFENRQTAEDLSEMNYELSSYKEQLDQIVEEYRLAAGKSTELNNQLVEAKSQLAASRKTAEAKETAAAEELQRVTAKLQVTEHSLKLKLAEVAHLEEYTERLKTKHSESAAQLNSLRDKFAAGTPTKQMDRRGFETETKRKLEGQVLELEQAVSGLEAELISQRKTYEAQLLAAGTERRKAQTSGLLRQLECEQEQNLEALQEVRLLKGRLEEYEDACHKLVKGISHAYSQWCSVEDSSELLAQTDPLTQLSHALLMCEALAATQDQGRLMDQQKTTLDASESHSQVLWEADLTSKGRTSPASVDVFATTLDFVKRAMSDIETSGELPQKYVLEILADKLRLEQALQLKSQQMLEDQRFFRSLDKESQGEDLAQWAVRRWQEAEQEIYSLRSQLLDKPPPPVSYDRLHGLRPQTSNREDSATELQHLKVQRARYEELLQLKAQEITKLTEEIRTIKESFESKERRVRERLAGLASHMQELTLLPTPSKSSELELIEGLYSAVTQLSFAQKNSQAELKRLENDLEYSYAHAKKVEMDCRSKVSSYEERLRRLSDRHSDQLKTLMTQTQATATETEKLIDEAFERGRQIGEREALEAEESSSVGSKLEVRVEEYRRSRDELQKKYALLHEKTLERQRKDESELVKLRTELSKIQQTHEKLIHHNGELERKLNESFKQMSRPISRASSHHDLIDPSDQADFEKLELIARRKAAMRELQEMERNHQVPDPAIKAYIMELSTALSQYV
jgi:DNA repair exonuclease SbcCD ATPase subunit